MLQVWQIDLNGPLPVTKQEFSYSLIALDMFSKYLVTVLIANRETMSVSPAFMQVLTKYEVCDTINSKLGTEVTSKCLADIHRHL